MGNDRRVIVENVNHPGQSKLVDTAMYDAMRKAYLEVLPEGPPGLTLVAIADELAGRLPQDLYPNGARAGWWAKTVQLDLEAKGLVGRERTTPIRLYRRR